MIDYFGTKKAFPSGHMWQLRHDLIAPFLLVEDQRYRDA